MTARAVLELIGQRKDASSEPGKRKDNARLALVIEGGGMRGVVSGAMTAALENLGLTNCFDAVYGASAGAMAGAFFVAKSARAGATIYYEHINNARFIDPWRLFAFRPILSLNYLVDVVFVERVPLDYQKIICSPIELNIVATSAVTGRKRVFNKFSNEDVLRKSLKATAANPLIAGRPIQVDGEPYWDAILSESIPVESARSDGCTHFVVLRSRPRHEGRVEMGVIERTVARIIMGRESGAAYEAYCSKSAAYSWELGLIESLGESCVTIAPSESLRLSQTTTERKALLQAAMDGYTNTLAAFGRSDAVVSTMIGHY